MNIALVGADVEENLGIGMIAAVAGRAGHQVTVVPFNEAQERGSVLEKLLSVNPRVIGLSMQFQHRSSEFLTLAAELRARGFTGHLTAGGQFPTLAWREVLADGHGLDSIVLHDGERSIVELLDALGSGAPLGEIAGLALVGPDGPRRTRGRPLVRDLDQLPFPTRYRRHSRHLGIPFIPIMGGRGCWGSCSYCSITSTYRDARAHGGGPTLRHRTPENVAEEMAELLRRSGPRAVFCFHDDNFLLPRPEASLRRIRAIRDALDRRTASQVGLIGKCRPDSLTPELALSLRALGVVRLYLGVENTSEPGLAHLGRGVRGEQVRQALAACQQAGIFVCYNLLLFEPDASLDDIATNIAFIRGHAEHPVNFGRAEPYFGTPLQQRLGAEGNLSGDYLGHGYRVKDDRTELLFRICAAVFSQRNYDPEGVHNRTMGVGYTARLLTHFFDDDGSGRCAGIARGATALTRRIILESADRLEEALALAAAADLRDRERIERETALLGLRIAEADGRSHAELDRFYQDVERFVARFGTGRTSRAASAVARRAAQLVQGAALVTLLAAGAEGCDNRPVPTGDPDARPLDHRTAVDPDVRPLDYRLVGDPDARPLDLKQPRDAGVDHPPPRDAGVEQMIVDPPPPPDGKIPHARLLDQWRDTAARQATRTDDLPLFDPPAIQLSAVSGEEPGIQVSLRGAGQPLSTRWEGDGEIVGTGTAVHWLPRSADDQLRVGVRSAGGVTVTTLRAKDVPPAARRG